MSKTILITGTSSGFGRDMAETLAQAGHHVYAAMRDVAGRNRSHAEALRAKGIHVVEIDVTDDASVERGVTSVLAQVPRLDVLVNNAGIGSAGIPESFTADQARALFEVNVFGVQRMLRAVLPALRRQGDGLVVNIGSVLGRVTLPFFGLYGASKFALEALTDGYRYELSASGIDVVLVQPSSYPTGIFASAQQPADMGLAAEYGEVGKLPEVMVQALTNTFQNENPPDPHDVAVVVANLVEQATGSRANRVVVGQSSGTDVINAQAASVQMQLLEGLGLSQLAGSKANLAA